MALSRCDSPLRSILDPLFDFGSLSSLPSMWEPLHLLDSFAARAFARNTNAVASTRVDWLETKDAHVFKADLPGTFYKSRFDNLDQTSQFSIVI